MWLQMHGKGRCEFLGSIYEGDFELNKKHGHGVLQYSDGHVYLGEFRDNRPSNISLSPLPHLLFLHAIFHPVLCLCPQSLRSAHPSPPLLPYCMLLQSPRSAHPMCVSDGRGELITLEGSCYEGEFVDGKRHGHGEMLWHSGDRYVGEWKDDYIHGTTRCEDGE